jgi:energy-coupling factor transport system permease protein
MTTTFYVDRPSPIHRLNPVTKLVAMLSIIVIVFAIQLWWVAALIVLVVVVPAAVISGTGGRLLSLALKLLLPLLIVLVLIQGLFFPEGTTVLAQWGPARVTVEGLLFALGIGSRITALVLCSLLLLITTNPASLMTSLSKNGMSPKMSYVISSTLQIIPAFQNRAESILLAQQARGLKLRGNPLRRIRALLPLVSPLILGMFTDVEERSTAMEARGFSSPATHTSLVIVPDSTVQRVARWVFVALAVASVVLSFSGLLS